jgi:hypothetical protein
VGQFSANNSWPEHSELAKISLRFKDDFEAYAEFLHKVYFAMKPYIRQSNSKYYELDTYLFSDEEKDSDWSDWPPATGFPFELGSPYCLRDYALPIIEAVELLRPGLFKSERLQDILDLIMRLEWARQRGDITAEERWQFEFGLALDRFWFNLERLDVTNLVLNPAQIPTQTTNSSDSDSEEKMDCVLPSDLPPRRHSERDATFLKWKEEGLTPAQIRDKWNRENPAARISVANVSSGRETVKKAIQREQLRKTQGTR